MNSADQSVDALGNLDISPGIQVDLGGSTWLSYCVRSLKSEDGHTSGEHLVLIYTASQEDSHELALPKNLPVPVRIHSECLLGDVFNSNKCDCRAQLSHSMELIRGFGYGIVIYLRQEGRGIGLYNKLLSFGVPHPDPFARNEMMGFPADNRQYDVAVRVLLGFDVKSVLLITGNPAKLAALEAAGIDVSILSSTISAELSREACSELEYKIQRGYKYENFIDGKAHKREG